MACSITTASGTLFPGKLQSSWGEVRVRCTFEQTALRPAAVEGWGLHWMAASVLSARLRHCTNAAIGALCVSSCAITAASALRSALTGSAEIDYGVADACGAQQTKRPPHRWSESCDIARVIHGQNVSALNTILVIQFL